MADRLTEPSGLPERIACLTTETVEVLWLLGQKHRVAGISGYTVYPPEARKEKPKICGFTSAGLDKILAVAPDLVLAFSNLQADIVRDCIKAGLNVHVFNGCSLADVFHMILTLGRLTDASDAALALVASLEAQLGAVRQAVADWPRRPRVYFEEWHEPQISAIRWVSELIGIAGGDDVFSHLSIAHAAGQRIVTPEQVLEAQPDVIIASWCGRKFNRAALEARPGWHTLPAVRNGMVFEVKSADLLVPGPTAITRGLPKLVGCLTQWKEHHG